MTTERDLQEMYSALVGTLPDIVRLKSEAQGGIMIIAFKKNNDGATVIFGDGPGFSYQLVKAMCRDKGCEAIILTAVKVFNDLKATPRAVDYICGEEGIDEQKLKSDFENVIKQRYEKNN